MTKIVHLAWMLGLLFQATEIQLYFLLYVFYFLCLVKFLTQSDQILLQEETELL